MKKTIALVVAGIVAGAAFVTALPHRAVGAAKSPTPETPRVLFIHVYDHNNIQKYSGMGFVIRAASACPKDNGDDGVEQTASACVVFQKP
jgi:hypothetical protein